MKSKLFLSVIPLLLFSLSSCDYFSQNQDSPCDEESHTLNEEVEADLTIENPIKEIGIIARKGNSLHFKDIDHARKTAAILSHMDEPQIDEWEKSIQYSSQRKVLNEKRKSEDIDDEEFAKERISLYFIETIFDAEGVVFIDSLKITHEGKNKFNAYNFINKQVVNLNFGNPSNILTKNNCNQYKRQHCDRYFHNNNYKVTGTKWNDGHGIYASVGFKTNYYLKNHKGKWKNAYAPSMLGANLDQWAKVTIYTIAGGNTYRSIRKEKRNAPHVVEKVIDWCMFCQNFCVTEFGRVHHWKDDDYNTDAHCEGNYWN